MRDFFSGLIAMRHANPVLRRGRFELLATGSSTVAYRMAEDGQSVGGGSAPSEGLSGAGRSIVVVANAGDSAEQLSFQVSGPAGSRVSQVSWKGREWKTTFAPRPLERGTLVVEIEAREGVVLGVDSAL